MRVPGDVDFVRVLLFPGGSQPPRFVWIQTVYEFGPTEVWDATQYLGTNDKDRMVFEYNHIQARSTRDYQFYSAVYIKDYALEDPPNLAARAFSRSGVCTGYLRGPIIVTSEQEGGYGTFLRNVSMRDARNAADYFSSIYRYAYPDQFLQSRHFLATRVACRGDSLLQTSSVKHNYDVVIGWDAIFRAESSGISNLLGIPILARPDSVSSTLDVCTYGVWHQDHHDHPPSYRENTDVMLLTRNVASAKAGQNGFGTSPEDRKYAGTVWLARADGLPLPHQHVEALVGYIRERVEPLFSRSLSGIAAGDYVPDREAVLNSITKADFEEYFVGMKAAKAVDDPTWAAVPSPYDMKKAYVNKMERFMYEIAVEQETARLQRQGLSN